MRKSARFLHKTPAYNRKKRSFLQLFAFAEKNAVSLTNQGCKGGQNGLLRRADEAEAVVVDPEAGVVELPVRDGTA